MEEKQCHVLLESRNRLALDNEDLDEDTYNENIHQDDVTKDQGNIQKSSDSSDKENISNNLSTRNELQLDVYDQINDQVI